MLAEEPVLEVYGRFSDEVVGTEHVVVHQLDTQQWVHWELHVKLKQPEARAASPLGTSRQTQTAWSISIHTSGTHK